MGSMKSVGMKNLKSCIGSKGMKIGKLAFIFMFGMCFIINSQTETLISTIEAETGIRTGGTTFANTHIGYLGSGYVTNFRNSSDKITISVTVPSKAFYRIKIRYSTAGNGNKNRPFMQIAMRV
jgi:hypothetical protein